MKNISILGSTGSIGIQTLEIVAAFPHKFKIIGLSAGNNIELLKKQIINFRPKYISVKEENSKRLIASFLKEENLKAEIYSGNEGLTQIATLDENELLIVAIVGTTSLLPTYQAITKGIPIALACKEVLVSAGKIIMDLARSKNVPILPIDSEHAAIKQCLAGIEEDINKVNNIILTASGGPFWNLPKEDFPKIDLSKALSHPNWSMGQKITIDSASLMNKGLEVIEAHHLFNIDFDQIKVIIHPQSIIHSMVEFKDGSLLAQLGLPDMRFPIQYALTYPDKLSNDWPKTNLAQLSDLQFFEPDTEKFPLLKLAFDTGKQGGSYPVVMNAANEAFVNLFLMNKISFIEIPDLIIEYVESFHHYQNLSLEHIVNIDEEVKEKINNEYK
jgi:1-deoxy-D-xylulose-5-phosphate reductoisomerase